MKFFLRGARAFAGMAYILTFASPARSDPQAYFSSHDDLQGHVRDAIDHSRDQLDIALFELSSPPLRESILRAARHGVKVRLLLDAKGKATAIKDDFLSTLEVRYLSGRRGRHGVMHNKFAVFDQERVVTGSFNWTSGGQFTNYENTLFEDDPAVVKAYSLQFNELWQRALPIGYLAPHSPDSHASSHARKRSRRLKLRAFPKGSAA